MYDVVMLSGRDRWWIESHASRDEADRRAALFNDLRGSAMRCYAVEEHAESSRERAIPAMPI